jgi:hypothetical protein
MYRISRNDIVQRKSFFNVSKEWFYILPFLLMPLCAFPNGFLNKIQFADLARIYFFCLGTICLFTLRQDAVKNFKVFSFIFLFFSTSNLIGVALASLKFEINGIISTIKLAVELFGFMLIPLCGIQYVINRISRKRLYKFYIYTISIVILVCIIQIFLILGIQNVISDFYSSFLYKYIEGSWNGSSPIKSAVLIDFRIKGTFHEPSVLSTFFLLYVFPFILCRYLNGYYSIGKLYDFVVTVLSFVCLIFSFSTTSYIMASIDLIIIFYYSIRKRLTLKKIFLILMIFIGTIYVLVTYYETYYRIVNRVFLFKSNEDQSSSTRIGSIVGGINLFIENPLGVGFTVEKHIVYDYLPKWGITKETSREKSNIQSHFFRYLADFGIAWIVFCFAALIKIILLYCHNKNFLLKWEREAIFLWMTNFLLCVTFGFIEYHNQWFLLSAIVILGPIFKNKKNKKQLVIETYQEKKEF